MKRNWAKTNKAGEPGIGVFEHCIHVGAVAMVWLRRCPAQAKALGLSPEFLAFLAAGHDVGKHSPGFLSKSPIWLAREGLEDLALREGWEELKQHGHEKVSQSALYDWFLAKGMSASDASLFSAMIGLHHGVLYWQELGAPINNPGARGKEWQQERVEIIEALYAAFGSPELPSGWQQNDERLFAIAGLISVCDWLGSDEAVFDPDLALPLPEAQKVAAMALDRYGFFPMELKSGLDFAGLFEMPPRRWQADFLAREQGRGPVLIEAPMGGGKTELALALTYKFLQEGESSGFFFALPTRASCQALLPRLEAFVAKISSSRIKMIHAASWLSEQQPQANGEISPLCRDWFASAHRALLAPIGIGTIDQLLLAVIAARHFQIRRFALLGKVIILDEIHSYDAYTGSLVERLLRLLEGLGCRIIVLSATLSASRRQILLPDMPPNPPAPYSLRPVVWLSRKAPTHLVAEVEAAAAAGAKVLWILSSVRVAQNLYRQLKGRGLKTLLHASFTPQDRAEKEALLLASLGKNGSRPKEGCIFVCSQIAEQSLDIDADLLVTDLCPGDALLQRIGRLWRHPRPERPRRQAECWLMDETLTLAELRRAEVKEIKDCFGPRSKIYSPYLLLRTLSALEFRVMLRLPQDIASLVQEIYEDASVDEPDAWRELRQAQLRHEQDHADQSRGAAAIWANRDWRAQKPPGTRIDSYPTREVVLVAAQSSEGVRLLDGRVLKFSAPKAELLRAAFPFIVRLPQSAQASWEPEPLWVVLGEAGRLELPEARAEFFYDSELGLNTKQEDEK
ncbi:MAG: hypothetical protein RL095_443 [Verrucomicrobiota bacterium]|jgi:CRISPR-associated endonuclease/helicase Cas3